MPSPPSENRPLSGALEPAWHADGTPFSPEFGDVYYSRDSGLEESRHVFLEGNALATRWSALGTRASFTIAETGFGTGLNFLLARGLWLARAPAGANLLFRSLEARPLSHQALARALQAWPTLAGTAAELLARWPPALAGLHTLEFDGGRVRLQLFFGDVEEALAEFADGCEGAVVDAWFLDGFAPARNPRMWSAEVLAQIGALTRAGGTAATFSAAAAVRRGLGQAGFAVHKTAGFGRKRDMIRAIRTDQPVPAPPMRAATTPWHRGAHVNPSGEREAIVVGAGIAGAATARALALRGWKVTVLEAAAEAANGASGNPQGILFTQLPLADSAHGEFTLASYLYALRWHAELLAGIPASHSACGLLQLYSEEERELFVRLAGRYAALPSLARALDREQACAHAGLALASGGMLLPGSGWVDPRAACHAALATTGVSLQCGRRVSELRAHGAAWTVVCDDGSSREASAVVLANARAAAALLPEALAPLEGVRGQLTLLPAAALPATPQCVVCADGYLVPPREGLACCGASFVRGAPADAPSEPEQRENLMRLAAIVPGFDPGSLDPLALPARVAERCTTPDRLPLAGPVPDVKAFAHVYAGLRANARRFLPARSPCRPGLFVNIGHGARGLTAAPLAAELIAADLCNEPLPVTRRVARALSPARFLVRRIVRGDLA